MGFTKDELTVAQKVARRLVGLPERVRKVDELPLVDELYKDQKEVRRAMEVLVAGHQTKQEIERLTKGDGRVPGLDGYKLAATAVCVGAEVPGYRYGDLAVTVSVQSRQTFNKEKMAESLLDAGVDPMVIRRCMDSAYEQGEPYYVVKWDRL